MSLEFSLYLFLSTVAFESYKNFNKVYPSFVVIFRDGVSEGRYNIVLKTEVENLERSAKNKNPRCKLSFVCVNKRIVTRFFDTRNDNLNNPISGTVVNSDIVSNLYSQFYLVSQSTTQGTVSPSSYDIIYNMCEWSVGDYQKLAYKLCHLYYNWTVIMI